MCWMNPSLRPWYSIVQVPKKLLTQADESAKNLRRRGTRRGEDQHKWRVDTTIPVFEVRQMAFPAKKK